MLSTHLPGMLRLMPDPASLAHADGPAQVLVEHGYGRRRSTSRSARGKGHARASGRDLIPTHAQMIATERDDLAAVPGDELKERPVKAISRPPARHTVQHKENLQNNMGRVSSESRHTSYCLSASLPPRWARVKRRRPPASHDRSSDRAWT